MSKLESIRSDLAALDAMTIASDEKRTLQENVNAIEREAEEVADRLRVAVRALDAYEATEEPAKKKAADFAMSLAQKYGKPIATLRSILESVDV